MLIQKIKCDRCGTSEEAAQVTHDSTAAIMGQMPMAATWGYMPDSDKDERLSGNSGHKVTKDVHFCPQCKAEWEKTTHGAAEEYRRAKAAFDKEMQDRRQAFNAEHYEPYKEQSLQAMRAMLDDQKGQVVSLVTH